MDRAEILQRLSQTHNAVYMGADRVRRQKIRLARLKRKGNELEKLQATALLASFEASLARHIEERNRLSKELVDFDRTNEQETWRRRDHTDF